MMYVHTPIIIIIIYCKLNELPDFFMVVRPKCYSV